MRVFLLGAGASKSYSASPTGERMPVARDFFDTFDKLDLSTNLWVLIGSIIAYIEDHLGAESAYQYLRSGIDIEDLHSQIEEERDRLLKEDGLIAAMHPYKAFNELVFLFAAVLNDIQNGPVSSAHMRLAEQLESDDVIVTFNWDTLLDRALAETTAWRPDWGYGVTPRAIFEDGWREPSRQPSDAGNVLIKLHGSTNWLTAYAVTDGEGTIVSGQDADPGSFGVFEKATKPYSCFRGRYMPGFEPYSYGYYPPNLDVPGRPPPEGFTIVGMRMRSPWRDEGEAPEGGLVSMPLIIPPVKHKSYDFFGDLFSSLWSSAEVAISKADEIVIIGYSFPQTDVQSVELFQRALRRRASPPAIVILDPNAVEIGERIAAAIDLAADAITVIPKYFTDDFDLHAELTERGYGA
ncbi:hypothetical protein [Sphingomonas koreensis]